MGMFNLGDGWYTDYTRQKTTHSYGFGTVKPYSSNTTGTNHLVEQYSSGNIEMVEGRTYYYCYVFQSDVSGSEQFFISNYYINQIY